MPTLSSPCILLAVLYLPVNEIQLTLYHHIDHSSIREIYYPSSVCHCLYFNSTPTKCQKKIPYYTIASSKLLLEFRNFDFGRRNAFFMAYCRTSMGLNLEAELLITVFSFQHISHCWTSTQPNHTSYINSYHLMLIPNILFFPLPKKNNRNKS